MGILSSTSAKREIANALRGHAYDWKSAIDTIVDLVNEAKVSLFLRLRVPSSTTVGEVKAYAVQKMQEHMTQFVPGVQLEPTYSHSYPTGGVSSTRRFNKYWDTQ